MSRPNILSLSSISSHHLTVAMLTLRGGNDSERCLLNWCEVRAPNVEMQARVKELEKHGGSQTICIPKIPYLSIVFPSIVHRAYSRYLPRSSHKSSSLQTSHLIILSSTNSHLIGKRFATVITVQCLTQKSLLVMLIATVHSRQTIIEIIYFT